MHRVYFYPSFTFSHFLSHLIPQRKDLGLELIDQRKAVGMPFGFGGASFVPVAEAEFGDRAQKLAARVEEAFIADGCGQPAGAAEDRDDDLQLVLRDQPALDLSGQSLFKNLSLPFDQVNDRHDETEEQRHLD